MKGTLENIAGEEEISHSNMRLFHPHLVSHFTPQVLTSLKLLPLVFFSSSVFGHLIRSHNFHYFIYMEGPLSFILGANFFLTSILLLLIPVRWSFSLVSPFYRARSGPLSVSLYLNSPTMLQLTKNRSSWSCLFPVSHPIRSTN